MDSEEILSLYIWTLDICFRHPGKGEVPTSVVGVIHPRTGSEREVRACTDCVTAMEDVRREEAERSGNEYQPGRLGDAAG